MSAHVERTYGGGLNPACALCRGACCESFIAPVRYADEDSQRWLSYHGEVTEQGIYLDCKCAKLKHGKCGIYESRPNVCRTFQVGSPNCIASVYRRREHKAEHIIQLMEAGRGKAEEAQVA